MPSIYFYVYTQRRNLYYLCDLNIQHKFIYDESAYTGAVNNYNWNMFVEIGEDANMKYKDGDMRKCL